MSSITLSAPFAIDLVLQAVFSVNTAGRDCNQM